MRLSNDLIIDILTSYVLMPWLSKQIYNICINGKIYKEKIIERFIKRLHIKDTKNIKNWDKVGKYNLSLVPKDKITIKMLKESKIYHKDESILKYAPIEIIDEEIALLDTSVLSRIPVKLRTREICKKAVKVDSNNIVNVPKKYIDQEFYDILISNPTFSIPYIPEYLLTKEIIYKAIKDNPSCLSNVPSNMRNKELYDNAILVNERSIIYVPYEFLDENLCMNAVNKNIYMVHYIEPKIKHKIMKKLNKQLCLEDKVRYDLINIKRIDVKDITKEICDIYLDRYYDITQEIPKNIQSREMWIKAISKYIFNYKSVPHKYKDLNFHLEIAKTNPQCITLFDNKFRYNEKWYQLDPANAAYMGDQYINRFIKEFNL